MDQSWRVCINGHWTSLSRENVFLSIYLDKIIQNLLSWYLDFSKIYLLLVRVFCLVTYCFNFSVILPFSSIRMRLRKEVTGYLCFIGSNNSLFFFFSDYFRLVVIISFKSFLTILVASLWGFAGTTYSYFSRELKLNVFLLRTVRGESLGLWKEDKFFGVE